MIEMVVEEDRTAPHQGKGTGRDNNELPEGWFIASLGELCSIYDSERIPVNSKDREKRVTGKKQSELYPYYGATGQVGWIDNYIFDGEYVLLGEDGAPFLDFSKDTAYIAHGKFWVNNHAHILIGHPSNRYFCFYLNQADFREFVTGTTRLKLNQSQMKKIPVPVAPKQEQQRIVSKLEELFSKLDKGIESFKTARKQLMVYRQAVLKHAFEGKLTEEWRKKHAGELESAETLLEKIKAEREQRYRQQLDDWKRAVKAWEAGGKESKKPTKPGKPKELPPLTEEKMAELSKLPENWIWEKLSWMTLGVEYGTSAKSQKVGKVPVLRMGNIQKSSFDWSDLVFSDDEDEIDKYRLKKGNVLFNRTNSPELVGKTAIYQGEQEAIFAGYLIRVNQIPNIASAKFLNYFLNSCVAKNQGNKVKTDGVNQSNINGNKLIHYPFPYCSLHEQEEVVREIESRFSITEKLERDIEDGLKQAEALRQSLLKKAFQGKLVPQDPNDEPASILLERIKTEKAKLKQKARKEKTVAA